MSSELRTVKIKTLNSQVYQFQVQPDIKISEFKALVQEKTQVPVDRQRLVYMGKVLVDDAALSTYVKDNEQTVHLIARTEAAQPAPAQSQPEPQPQTQPQQQQMPNFLGLNPLNLLGNGAANVVIRSVGPDIGANIGNIINSVLGGLAPQQQPRVPPPQIQPQTQPYAAQQQPQQQSQQPYQQQQPHYHVHHHAQVPHTHPQAPQQPHHPPHVQPISFPFNVLYNLGLQVSQMMGPESMFPGPPLPQISNRSGAQVFGGYLSAWHFQISRLLPFVYRLGELLQRQNLITDPIQREEVNLLFQRLSPIFDNVVQATSAFSQYRSFRLGSSPSEFRLGDQNPHQQSQSHNYGHTHPHSHPQPQTQVNPLLQQFVQPRMQPAPVPQQAQSAPSVQPPQQQQLQQGSFNVPNVPPSGQQIIIETVVSDNGLNDMLSQLSNQLGQAGQIGGVNSIVIESVDQPASPSQASSQPITSTAQIPQAPNNAQPNLFSFLGGFGGNTQGNSPQIPDLSGLVSSLTGILNPLMQPPTQASSNQQQQQRVPPTQQQSQTRVQASQPVVSQPQPQQSPAPQQPSTQQQNTNSQAQAQEQPQLQNIMSGFSGLLSGPMLAGISNTTLRQMLQNDESIYTKIFGDLTGSDIIQAFTVKNFTFLDNKKPFFQRGIQTYLNENGNSKEALVNKFTEDILDILCSEELQNASMEGFDCRQVGREILQKHLRILLTLTLSEDQPNSRYSERAVLQTRRMIGELLCELSEGVEESGMSVVMNCTRVSFTRTLDPYLMGLSGLLWTMVQNNLLSMCQEYKADQEREKLKTQEDTVNEQQLLESIQAEAEKHKDQITEVLKKPRSPHFGD